MLGAGIRLKGLEVVAAYSAAIYVGAVIGSIAVATARSLAGGTTISDVIATANQYGLNRPWLISSLHQLPGIYNPKVPAKSMYRYQAAAA